MSQCLLPGCKLSCPIGGNRKALEFCGNSHKSQAEGQGYNYCMYNDQYYNINSLAII